MRLINREAGRGCLVLSLALSFGLLWSLRLPSKTQEGIETHSNPNKVEAWQEVAVGSHGSSRARSGTGQVSQRRQQPFPANPVSLDSSEPTPLNTVSQALSFPRSRARPWPMISYLPRKPRVVFVENSY